MDNEIDETSSDKVDETTTPVETQPEAKEEVDQDKVVLTKEQHAKLVSQRDSNFSKSEKLEDKVNNLTAKIERDEYVDDFLKANKSKYPYVDREDLLEGTSPDEVEAIAVKIQTKGEKIAELERKKINELPRPVKLTGEAKEQKLDNLREKAKEGKDVFGEYIVVEGKI